MKGTTPRMQTLATGVADELRKPKGTITRSDIDAQIAKLNTLGASGDLSNQEALNISSLWMAVVERAAVENLMTPQEIVGSKQAMQAAIGSMMFSGGGSSTVKGGGNSARPELPRTTGSRVTADRVSIGKDGEAGQVGANGEIRSNGATNVINGASLNKSLASQQQFSEFLSGGGVNIAGNGTKASLRDAARLAAEYGGQPGAKSAVQVTRPSTE